MEKQKSIEIFAAVMGMDYDDALELTRTHEGADKFVETMQLYHAQDAFKDRLIWAVIIIHPLIEQNTDEIVQVGTLEYEKSEDFYQWTFDVTSSPDNLQVSTMALTPLAIAADEARMALATPISEVKPEDLKIIVPEPNLELEDHPDVPIPENLSQLEPPHTREMPNPKKPATPRKRTTTSSRKRTTKTK